MCCECTDGGGVLCCRRVGGAPSSQGSPMASSDTVSLSDILKRAEKTLLWGSVWVPFVDRVPNDRTFHKCNKLDDLVLTVTVLT